MWRKSRFLLVGALIAAAIALIAQDDVIHVSTELVTVTVLVTDKNGRPIEDMKRSEFTILDNGRKREMQAFHRELDMPLTLGLVADVTGSQSEFVSKHKDDLHQFFKQTLRPVDRAFLVSILNTARLDVDITDSVDSLHEATENLKGTDDLNLESFGGECRDEVFEECGSLIWNGVWGSAKLKLHPVEGRKAIVLLSDGQDTGSVHSLTDAIEAAQAADAPVYTISSQPSVSFAPPVIVQSPGGIGISGGSPVGGIVSNATGIKHLRRLAEETGGAYFKVERNPSKIFRQIEDELRHLYLLSFSLPEADRDGKFHKLVVKSSRAGVRVRARSGYVAN
jgi:VWFA-related protein